MRAMGVDIGGSGIKGAVVDTDAGELLTERYRIPTPRPSTPPAVAAVVRQVVGHFGWSGPVGVGFPAAIRGGVAMTAANVSKKWIGADVQALLSEATSCPCHVLNDADAAAVAEMRFGAGRDHTGVVLLLTIGTGLGTALFTEGRLLPNTELGHMLLPFNGKEAERWASDATRKRKSLSWRKWGKRLGCTLRAMEELLWPDLIVIGGGACKKLDRFADLVEVRAPVVAATALNQAGIVGAATWAADLEARLVEAVPPPAD